MICPERASALPTVSISILAQYPFCGLHLLFLLGIGLYGQPLVAAGVKMRVPRFGVLTFTDDVDDC